MDFYEFRARQDSRVEAEVEDLAEKVIGAAIEVHRELGPGLSELNYLKALCHELKLRQIPHRYEVPISITYKGAPIGDGRIDLLVGDKLIVELKAVETLSPVHRAQALTYFRVTHLQLALVINFNVAILKDAIKRVINTA
jgi:GxxExxY protein